MKTDNLEFDNLISWKTDAWKDKNMVSWYSERMTENTSTLLLKNKLELDIIEESIKGKDILDIGIGTGRGSRPLIKKGYNVTGIDSSQAMLDETRRLAEDDPIELKVGDVYNLPVEDNSFDSIISLNVMVHFPNWQDALTEWKRVLRKNGRIIFDIHSADHVYAAFGSDKKNWSDMVLNSSSADKPNSYMSRLSSDELVEYANKAGFKIINIIPYGAFLGGGNYNLFLYNNLERTKKWARLLSWFAKDEVLFDLGLFIEKNIIQRLTSSATGRFFVILENQEDNAGNIAWKKLQEEKNTAILTGDVNVLTPYLGTNIENIAIRLNNLLLTKRNKIFTYSLIRELVRYFENYDFGNLFTEEIINEFTVLLVKENLDKKSIGHIRSSWLNKEKQYYKNVDTVNALEIDLVKAILNSYLENTK